MCDRTEHDRPGPATSTIPVVAQLDGVSWAIAGGGACLDGVDFRLHRGEVVALLGVPGAGKSIVLDLLCGDARPDIGIVRLGAFHLPGERLVDIHSCGSADRARIFEHVHRPSAEKAWEIPSSSRIAIFDEPTTHLGGDVTAAVLQAVAGRDATTAVVLAGHDRHILDALRPRCVLLIAGRIEADEPWSDAPGTALQNHLGAMDEYHRRT